MSDNAVPRRILRIFSMSGDEFVTRSRQELGKRADGVLARLGYDFSEAPSCPSSGPKFFFDADEVPVILSLLQKRIPDEYNKIVPRAECICAHRFDLLGYRDLDYGKEIDWSLDRVHGKHAPRKVFYKIRYLNFDECGDVKVTWELNRHQHFLTLAKAYRITGDQRFADEIFAQLEHWIRQNPYPWGVNWASSLELAFRSLSWIWTYYLLGDAATLRPGFRDSFVRRLSVHGRAIERYLSTYFSPNTHLLGEAVALFFLGVLCPELPSAKRWKNLGWKITVQEAQRQVCPDGLHFEQSLYYHVYAIDFFLHGRMLAARNDIVVPADYDATIERMLSALAILGRTGTVPRIGDDDGGRLFDGQRNRTEHMFGPLTTGAVLYKRGDFKALARSLREETLWLLGPAAADTFDGITEQPPQANSAAFTDTGLYVMNDPDRQIVIDAGPLGAGSGGHGHADSLSIWVTDHNGPVLIDSGTFEYIGDGEERSRYRARAAHNTITIGGISQPEPRGPFAWSHHPKSVAETWINGEHFDFFSGTCDAYATSTSPVMYRRVVFSIKSGLWFVRDIFEGAGEHKLDAYWHLAPEFVLSGEGRFVRANNRALDVIATEGNSWSRKVERGSWSPAYGQAQPAPVLHFSTVGALPTEFATLFTLREDATAPPGLLRTLGESSAVRAYIYTEIESEHSMFFAADAGLWSHRDWSSNAEFLCWGHEADRSLLILCGGSKVTFGTQEVLISSQRIPYCEVVCENGEVQVLGPNRDAIAVNDSAVRDLTASLAATTRHQVNS